MADSELEDFVLNLNREAMNYLKDENYELALKNLKNADRMLKTLDKDSNIKLQAVTLNNFGCFYKRLNKPNVALKFLNKARKKESIEPIDNLNLAGTLLNMCAIYSKLGKHEIALEHSGKALQLVEKCDTPSPNLISTLIIGYHNTGVEYEFLNLLKQAVDCYKNAWECAVKQLTENNPLTQSMYKSYKEALEKLEKNENRFNNREQSRANGRVLPQVHEKRVHSSIPVVTRLPVINPYTKSKPKDTKKKTDKKIVSVSETDTDLSQMRFLTGDRLQPMYKNNSYKPSTVDYKNTTNPSLFDAKNSAGNPYGAGYTDRKNNTQNNFKKNYNIIKEEPYNETVSSKGHFRTSSAPVSVAVGNLQQRIKNLENRYDDFDKKFKPIKEKLPDLQPTTNKTKNTIKKDPTTEKLVKKTPEDTIKPNSSTLKTKEYVAMPNTVINIDKKPEILDDSMTITNLSIDYIIKIQSLIRGFMYRKQFFKRNPSLALKHYLKETQAQFMFDSAKEAVEEVRNAKEKSLTNRIHATKVVQGCFRGYAVRKDMMRKHEAAITIQKFFRKCVCKYLYKNIKGAVIYIQAFYRGYLVRKNLKLHTS